MLDTSLSQTTILGSMLLVSRAEMTYAIGECYSEKPFVMFDGSRADHAFHFIY